MNQQLSVYSDFLRRSLPPRDRFALTDEDLTQIVLHCLAVRNAAPWGASIPEDIFRAFVVFPRINNEDLTIYHKPLWAALGPRIMGLSLENAVKEVNFWCYSQAFYRPTDNRTANPLTVIRRGFGRCGEESTLLTSALRSCGIPARQVYVPRWSHCDDNHAWVEAWIDGNWRYLGACEPEPVLDSGWFTAAASKAMLVHTRAFGILPEGEIPAGKEGNSWILNRTGAYARTRKVTVSVCQNGLPLSGITVQFMLLNGAELYPINTRKTGENGQVSLLTGLGTLFVHVHDGCRYWFGAVEGPVLTVDFGDAVLFETASFPLRQQPPPETRSQQWEFPPEMRETHEIRMAECERLRKANEEQYEHSCPILATSRGNHGAIRRFWEEAPFPEEDRLALLYSLPEKDLADVTLAVLEDAIATALPHKHRYPREVWVESVLCPRVWEEMLYPDRAWLGAQFDGISQPLAVWQALSDKIHVDEPTPDVGLTRVRHGMEAGVCGDAMRDVVFVALCRAKGVAARLDPVTKRPQIWDQGGYTFLLPQHQTTASLTLENPDGTERVYGQDFTLARLEGGAYHTLDLAGTRLGQRLTVAVVPGHYRVICCTRQADGTVDARIIPVLAQSGETEAVTLDFCPDRTRELLVYAPLPPLVWEDAQIPPTVSPSLTAFLAPGQEPTEHFLNELLEARDLLNAKAIPVFLVTEKPSSNEKLAMVHRQLSRCRVLSGPDLAVVARWRSLLHAGDLRLPLAVAADSQGRGLFAFANYHVGSVMTLLRMLEA